MKYRKKKKIVEETTLKLPICYRIKKIAFSNHAVERWNQRVGPRANKYSLNALLLDLLRLKRIRFIDHDMAIIDNEIVFYYTYNGTDTSTIVIQTFIGRISLKPLITNKEYVQNRYVFLDVAASVIVKQKFPEITKYQRMQVDETNAQLHFNTLSVEEQRAASWTIAYSFRTSKQQGIVPLDQSQISLIHLNKGSKELYYG